MKGDIISCHGLNIGYPGHPKLVSDLDWMIECEQTWALLGRNGSGKSTLFRCLSDIQKPLNGELKPVGAYANRHLNDLVRFTPTGRTANPNMTVRQFIELGAYKRSDWLGRLNEKERKKVSSWSERSGIYNWIDRKIGTLSDGQFQRIRICQALISEAPVLLLDEPTASLDFKGREEVLELLSTIQAETGIALVFSTHELDLAARFAHRFLLLSGNGLYEILEAPQNAEDLKRQLLSFD
jgi:iron complex transport system ATP-binding protein